MIAFDTNAILLNITVFTSTIPIRIFLHSISKVNTFKFIVSYIPVSQVSKDQSIVNNIYANMWIKLKIVISDGLIFKLYTSFNPFFLTNNDDRNFFFRVTIIQTWPKPFVAVNYSNWNIFPNTFNNNLNYPLEPRAN